MAANGAPATMGVVSEIFDNVVCGVDDSDAGLVAARLAARVATAGGTLALVSVENTKITVHAGWQMAAVSTQLESEAREALERGREAIDDEVAAESRLRRGEPIDVLLDEVDRRRAGLIVVGSHGFSRPVGIALGSVATQMLHEAPCSVLLARPPRDLGRWPRSIVIGIDGSPESAAAARAGRELAARLGATVREVVAADAPVDLDAAHEISPGVEVLSGRPVDELSVLSERADLVVVGSRGLKGVRALGSVSERVAHEARCPVLVVR
jgi:nucleotide-binding universal stress UspA family protein